MIVNNNLNKNKRRSIGYELRAVEVSNLSENECLEILPIEPTFALTNQQRAVANRADADKAEVEVKSKKTFDGRISSEKTLFYKLEAMEKLLASEDQTIQDRRWREVVLKLLVEQQIDKNEYALLKRAKDAEIRQLNETINLLNHQNQSLESSAESLQQMIDKMSRAHETVQDLNVQYQTITETLISREQTQSVASMQMMQQFTQFSQSFNNSMQKFQIDVNQRISTLHFRISDCQKKLQSIDRNVKHVPPVVTKIKQADDQATSKQLLEALEKLTQLQEISKNLF